MIFDVEGDGLFATKIHVLAYTEGKEVKYTHDYDKMRTLLRSAKQLIGHNITTWDIPTLERILDIKITARIIDTLALSWYLQPFRNQHGLDGYGKEFGIEKPKINDWESLTKQEYAHRCVEDVKINRRLFKDQKSKLLRLYGDKDSADRLINYLQFKMDCAREQERSGWKLDVDLAQSTYDELLVAQEEKIEQLKSVMPPVTKWVTKTRPAKPFKKDGTWSTHGAKWFNLLRSEGLPEDYDGEVKVPGKVEEPNPNSSIQLKDWLFSLGWEPMTFDFKPDGYGGERSIPQLRIEGDGGKELCPSVLELIEEEPAVAVLEGLSVIQHRLGIFKGFLENQEDGWLKAEIAGFTNTLRFKHRVIVNLPGVGKSYGPKVRGSLIAPDNYILCGSDMVSLEDTTKRHYMWDYDPDYVLEMAREGFDPHLDLAKFAGKCTQQDIDRYNEIDKMENPSDEDKIFFKKLKSIRKLYKTANYACIYGVGAKKLARSLKITQSAAKELIETYWQRNWSIKQLAEDLTVKTVDGESWLLNPVSGLWYSLRNEKDKFSTLNQGTGVYCFDSWIKEFRSKRPQLTGQFHDEVILCIKKGAEDKCTNLLESSIEKVNDRLNLNIKLGVDIQFGPTYADIH